MSAIELLIFDFDGTLVDTAPDLIRSTNFYLQAKGFEPLSEERIRSEIGMGLRKLIVDVYPGEELKDAEFRRRIESEFMQFYDREFLTSPEAFPGAREFLTDWEGQIAIVSNKRTRYIHPILEKLGLDAFPWSSIIGDDTYTNMKPHPEPFMGAIQAAGASPETTLVIGDGAPDIEGAVSVGCRSLAVEFGYTPASELMDLGAWKSLPSFADLAPLVETIR